MNIAITCPDKTLEADSTPKSPPGANLEKATKERAAALNINSRLIITNTVLFFDIVPNKPITNIIAETINILLRVILIVFISNDIRDLLMNEIEDGKYGLFNY